MSAIKKIFVSSSFHESFEFGFNDERKLLKDKINGEDDLTDNSLDHGHPEASQGTKEASLQRVATRVSTCCFSCLADKSKPYSFEKIPGLFVLSCTTSINFFLQLLIGKNYLPALISSSMFK